MLKIQVGNSTSQIVDIDRVPVPVYQFMSIPYYVTVSKPRGKGKGFYPVREMRYIRLYNRKNGTFPTGYLFRLIHYLEDEHSIKCVIEDYRRIHYERRRLHLHIDFKFWAHQLLACYAAVEVGRGIIALPTASGKTAIAGLLIHYIGRPALFMVNGLDLFRQAMEDFRIMFPDERIGCIGEGKFDPGYITVGMLQTLWAHREEQLYIDYLKEIDLLIGDEIHHVSVAATTKNKGNKKKKRVRRQYPGNVMYSIVQMTDAYWRFGLSATPGLEGSCRRMLMQACIGTIVYKATYEELRDKGILADLMIFMVETPPLEKVKGWRPAYDTVIQKGYTMTKLILDIAAMLYSRELTTIIMANRLNIFRRLVEVDEEGKTEVTETVEDGHAKILIAELAIRNIKSELLCGTIPSIERFHHLKELNTGTLPMVVSTLLKEGINVPYLKAVVYACGGRAATELSESDSPAPIQAVGRALRNPKDKGKAIHIDFIHKDNGVLEEHSEERYQAYREHGLPVRRIMYTTVGKAIDEWLRE